MSASKRYYFLVGRAGLCPDGTLSRSYRKWQKFSSADVDRHLHAGTRPTGMKSGDFHQAGSMSYYLAVGARDSRIGVAK